MIKKYKDGNEFLKDNKEYLDTKKYQSVFLVVDAPLLKEHTKTNYALRVDDGNKKLIMMKVEPFNVIFFGDKECANEMLEYAIKEGYVFDNYFSEEELGFEVKKILKDKYGLEYEYALPMDFMEARNLSEDSYDEVIKAKEEDVKELTEMMRGFVRDCNLLDKVDEENVRKKLDGFRIIKKDGKIQSCLCISKNASDNDYRISDVYTRDEARGKGYARKLVTSAKNEIIRQNKVATLNVSQTNPITNHLYSSIGFKKLFSQGEFRKKS